VATKSSIRFMLACATLLALACASDDGPGSMDAVEFCESYVDAMCEGLEQCCGDATGVDQAACRSLERSYCENMLLTLDDRGMAPVGPSAPARIVFDFDEEAAAATLARVNGVFDRCQGDAYVTFDDTHYLGEPGTECLDHRDCVEGTRCEHPPRAVFGTCVLAPLEGQPCTDVCAAKDLVCVQDANESVCVARRREGESCDDQSFQSCEDGLTCMSVSTIIGGGGAVCGRPGADGEPCSDDSQCDSYFCSVGRCAGGSSQDELFCGRFPSEYFLSSGGFLNL
jgi:hypothetical protein